MVRKGPVRIMDAGKIARTIAGISREILKSTQEIDDLVLIGIRSRGVPLAERLGAAIAKKTGRDVPVGILDINLYRDDLSLVDEQPVLRKTEIPFRVSGRNVVLVDDVLFTGRTIRAALEGLIDLGRPKRIQLAVLIDRGHRELPIQADFVGRSVRTSREQAVEVRFTETDGEDSVFLAAGGRP